MLAAIAVQSFTPPTRMASVSTRTNGVSMQAGSRRELLSQVGGAAFALAGVAQSASAKAGQFGKQDVFGIGSAPLPQSLEHARARSRHTAPFGANMMHLGYTETGAAPQDGGCGPGFRMGLRLSTEGMRWPSLESPVPPPGFSTQQPRRGRWIASAPPLPPLTPPPPSLQSRRRTLVRRLCRAAPPAHRTSTT